jgi:DNA-binding Lrp family transcriptional regulator
MSSLDETDHKILEILRKDARTPYTEIASTLGVSDSTIHVRLKKIKEEGVIKAYTIDMDEEKLGKKVHGLAMINVNLGHLDEVVPRLVAMNNIDRVYETHGVNDLVVLITASDLDELRKVLLQIRLIENIASTALTTILKIWK